jgi:hypothetical protein
VDKQEESMSYCRRGVNSDVYVYMNNNDRLICTDCSLAATGQSFSTKRQWRMVYHLQEHVRNNQKVPNYALARLMEEIILDKTGMTVTVGINTKTIRKENVSDGHVKSKRTKKRI